MIKRATRRLLKISGSASIDLGLCGEISISIVNQLKALHRYVDTTDELAGAEVLEFVGNGYTGTNFERPAMQELLEMVRQSQVNCIIVKDFSRFGRNSIEVGYFM